MKWFETNNNNSSNYVASRIRLSRNSADYKFPYKLAPAEARDMIDEFKFALRDIPSDNNGIFEYADFEKMEVMEKSSFRERKLLNRTLEGKKTPGGIIYSEDDKISIVLNGEDHIRLQVMDSGFALDDCFAKADMIDDYMSSKINIAFNSKYGYLTTYPTNVGTAMKASVIVHLPSLSKSKRFQDLIGDMSRFGTVTKGLYGRGTENYGDLFEIANQKTLGMSEQDILTLVKNVSEQISKQETDIRQDFLEKNRLLREDEAYKAYGVLKYARKLTYKEAMIYMSTVRAAICDGILVPKTDVSIYSLMIGLQPGNLQKESNRPLTKDDLDVERARYIRRSLPEIK